MKNKNEKQDGIDYINIDINAKTPLGKFLSIHNETPFIHSHLGRFNSIKRLWIYLTLKEKNDAIRTLRTSSLNAYVKPLPRITVKHFKALVLDGCYQRIQQFPEFKKQLIESKLPFESYYLIKKSGIPVVNTYSLWYVEGHEEIRQALIEGREPNFDRFKSDDTDIYSSL